MNLQAVEAARLSKAAGRPVQVRWTREEEFFNDTFRPAAVVKVQSGIDDAGPARMLGRIYQQTPGWPLLGSSSKSIEYLERARKMAPDNLRNSLWLGLSYESAGKVKRAKELLAFVIASKNHSGRELEEEALKREAAEHLKGLGSK